MTLHNAPIDTALTAPGTCPFADSITTKNDTQRVGSQADAISRSNLSTIPCPALRGFYQNRMLNPDSNGNLKKQELYQALRGVGITHRLTKFLLKQAPVSSDDENSIALFKLRDSVLDHSGSSGILDPVDNKSKLDEFLGITDSTRLFVPDLAAACNQFTRKEPGLKGSVIQTIELAALMCVFAQHDSKRGYYLRKVDIEQLWLAGHFPKGWTPRNANSISFGSLLRTTVNVMAWRFWHFAVNIFT